MGLGPALIPFYFASGYGGDAGLSANLPGSVVVRKPKGVHDLYGAITTVFGA